MLIKQKRLDAIRQKYLEWLFLQVDSFAVPLTESLKACKHQADVTQAIALSQAMVQREAEDSDWTVNYGAFMLLISPQAPRHVLEAEHKVGFHCSGYGWRAEVGYHIVTCDLWDAVLKRHRELMLTTPQPVIAVDQPMEMSEDDGDDDDDLPN